MGAEKLKRTLKIEISVIAYVENLAPTITHKNAYSNIHVDSELLAEEISESFDNIISGFHGLLYSYKYELVDFCTDESTCTVQFVFHRDIGLEIEEILFTMNLFVTDDELPAYERHDDYQPRIRSIEDLQNVEFDKVGYLDVCADFNDLTKCAVIFKQYNGVYYTTCQPIANDIKARIINFRRAAM